MQARKREMAEAYLGRCFRKNYGAAVYQVYLNTDYADLKKTDYKDFAKDTRIKQEACLFVWGGE